MLDIHLDVRREFFENLAVVVGEFAEGLLVEHLDGAGESMENIVGVVHSIDELNTHVATALEEQRAVTENISRHMSALAQAACRT